MSLKEKNELLRSLETLEIMAYQAYQRVLVGKDPHFSDLGRAWKAVEQLIIREDVLK